MNQIIQHIKICRVQAGLSQGKVAEKLNISQSAYAKIENNVTRLDLERLVQICQVLDIDLPGLIRMYFGESDQVLIHQLEEDPASGQKTTSKTVRQLQEEIRFLRLLLQKVR
jgi:transcriptional regulator with XRE-family HTH domain